MSDIKNTGGVKEFKYSKEDYKRIEKTDTSSTKIFKEALKNCKSKKKKRKSKIKKKAPPKVSKIKKKAPPKVKKKEQFKKDTNKTKIMIIAILALTIIIMIILFYSSNEEQKIITQEIEEEINFDNLNLTPYQNISVKGYLTEEIIGSEESGFIRRHIVDDFNNSIEITNIDEETKDLFPRGEISEKTYLIFGTAIKRQEYSIKFDSIKEYKRETYNITKEISINETEALESIKNITKALAYSFTPTCQDGTKWGYCSDDPPKKCSFNRIVESPKDCGCPEGERVYKNECIKEISCNDGTLHPECSTDNYQCFNGKLIINAEECGCPKEYKYYKGECVTTCDDGTPEGTCSRNKPYYCENDKLIENANECGCPKNQEKYNEICYERERIIEFYIFEYTNDARNEYGLNSLEWSDDLSNIARLHSEDMVENNFYSHINLQGQDPTDRARSYGFNVKKSLGGGSYQIGIAENIGIVPINNNVINHGYVSASDTEKIASIHINSWMNSPGHKANILNPVYTHLGVGVASNSHESYGTQNFW